MSDVLDATATDATDAIVCKLEYFVGCVSNDRRCQQRAEPRRRMGSMLMRSFEMLEAGKHW